MISRPADVVELTRRFRKTLGDKLTLMVDVGYLFHDVATAARVTRELESLDIFFFETPFPGRFACSLRGTRGAADRQSRWRWVSMASRNGSFST